MSSYIVSFELNGSSKNNIESAIISLASDYCELHKNAWIFTTEKSEKVISDTLLSAITAKDRLFFCIASSPYNCLLNSKAVDYIKAKKLW